MAAAQHTQASRLLFSEDELLQFITHLRANDFTIGSDQIINLYDLLLAYATQYRLPADPLHYATLIAPIVCQNPSDQQRFSHLWQQWLKQHGHFDVKPADKTKRDAPDIAQSPDEMTRRTRFWPFLLLAAYLTAAFMILSPYIQYFINYDEHRDASTTQKTAPEIPDQVNNTPPPEAPEPQKKPQVSELDKVLSISGGEITQIDKSFAKDEMILDISADGQYLLTGDDTLIRERVRESGDLRNLFVNRSYSNIRYSTGGKYLIFTDPNEAIEIWRRSDRKKVYTSDQYTDDIQFSWDDSMAVTFSNKKIIALAFADDRDALEIFNENLRRIEGVEKGIGPVAMYHGLDNPDRAMILASMGQRDTPTDSRDWNSFLSLIALNGTLLSKRAVDVPVSHVSFTPDGTGFVTYQKNTLSFWQLPEYKNIAELKKTPVTRAISSLSRDDKGVLMGLRPVTIKLNTDNNENFQFLNNQTVLYQHNGQCKSVRSSSPAIRLGPATQTDGKSGQCQEGFYDPGAGGSCYSCPPGSKRSIYPVTSKEACQVTEEQCTAPGMAIWHIPSRQVYDISEKLGIPTDKLVTAANAGRYVSYIAEKGLLPLEKQTFWQRPEARYSVPVVPAVLLLVWMLWNVRRRRLWLKRRETSGSADLETLHVSYDDHGLWQNESLKRGLQRLRQYQYRPTRRLNVPASVEATVRQGGFFQSVFSHRPVQPEYLLLIDQVHVRDFQRLLIDAWVRRLRDEGLHVSAWYFYQDLRVCYAEKGARILNIEELAARYDNYRLLVVSDVQGLFDPLSGEPVDWLRTLKSWQDRAVMTPRAGELWGHREATLNREGFAIVPIDEAGFEVLGDYFTTEPDNRVSGAPVLRPFNVVPLPPTILRNSERWLRESPASEQQVKRLIRELRAYLGEDAWLLLCASAVYPVIDWNMTLYLDQVLSSQTDNLEPRHQKLLRLSRLPWFRHANMPDYLRLIFIQSMSRQQEKQVRRAIQALLKSALTPMGKTFDLEFAVGSKPGSRRWLRDFLRTLPPEDMLHDHIFISMMQGRRASKLNMALPRALNRLFPGKVARIKRLITGIALLMAIGMLTTLWIDWPELFPVPYTAKINTIELDAKEIESQKQEPQKETTPPKEEPQQLKEAIRAISERNVLIRKQLKQLEKLDSYKSYDEYKKFTELKSAVDESSGLFERQVSEFIRFGKVLEEDRTQNIRLRSEFDVLIKSRKQIIATIANTLYVRIKGLYVDAETYESLIGGELMAQDLSEKGTYLGNYAVEIMSSVFGERAEETKQIKQKVSALTGNRDLFTLEDSSYGFHVNSSGKPVIISFWSSKSSSGSSVGINPILSDIAFQYSEKYRFGKLDIASNPQTAKRYGVRNVPLLILTEKGEEKARIAGITTREQLEKWIQNDFKSGGTSEQFIDSYDWQKRHVKYTNIKLNNTAQRELTVKRGEKVTVTMNWALSVERGEIYCPTCIVQLYMGVKGHGNQCYTSRTMTPGSSGRGDIRYEFTAPDRVGTYYVTNAQTLDYSCKKVEVPDDPGKAFARITVERGEITKLDVSGYNNNKTLEVVRERLASMRIGDTLSVRVSNESQAKWLYDSDLKQSSYLNVIRRGDNIAVSIRKKTVNRTTEPLKADRTLDASGINEPLPILRAKKELAKMRPGQVLEVIATDPGSVKDFESFARQTGNKLIESKEEGGKFIFLLRKPGSTRDAAARINTDEQQQNAAGSDDFIKRDLAQVKVIEGKILELEEFIKTAIEKTGRNNIVIAEKYSDLAGFLIRLGLYKKAISYYDESLAIYRVIGKTNTKEVAEVYRARGFASINAGDTQSAIYDFGIAGDIYKQLPGDHIESIRELKNLNEKYCVDEEISPGVYRSCRGGIY